MNKSLLKELNLTEEEWDKQVTYYVDELETEEQRKRNRMHDKKEDIFLNLIKDLEEHSDVNVEDMLYFPEKYNLSTDDFDSLFSTLIEYAEVECRPAIDIGIQFEHIRYYMTYKKFLLEFFEMYGQGTYSRIKLVSEEEKLTAPSKSTVSFEGYMKHIKNHYKPIHPKKQAEK